MCIALTGCEGGGKVEGKHNATAAPGLAAAPSPMSSLAAADIPFYKCMEQHGLTLGYGDDGAPHVEDKENPVFGDAQKACAPLEPSRAAVRATPEELAAARLASACMREHGVSWYPDPDPVTGEVLYQEPGGTAEQWQALRRDHRDAIRACSPRPGGR